MRKVLCLCIALITFPALAGAEQRYLEPRSFGFGGNGFGLSRLAYEYGPDGIRTNFLVSASFWPQTGTVEMTNHYSNSIERDVIFPATSGDSAPWFTPIDASGFEGIVQFGYLKPGTYDLTFSFETAAAWAFAEFDLMFPSFDFDESSCRGKGYVALDFSIRSLAAVQPTSIDSLDIELEDGKILTFKNIPTQGNSFFRWINIPLPEKYYNLLAGQSTQTAMTIGGETVSWRTTYPALTELRPSCIRG